MMSIIKNSKPAKGVVIESSIVFSKSDSIAFPAVIIPWLKTFPQAIVTPSSPCMRPLLNVHQEQITTSPPAIKLPPAIIVILKSLHK